MSKVIDPQRFYCTAEVARLFGVTSDAVGAWLRAGTLTGELRGKRWRVSGVELLRTRRVSRRALDPAIPTAVPPSPLPPFRPEVSSKSRRLTWADRHRRRLLRSHDATPPDEQST